MWQLSQGCNLWMERTSNSELPIVKMRQGVILGLRVSGIEDRSPSSMFRFFNLAPPLIETGIWQLYIDPMKEWRSGSTERESEKLVEKGVFTHWFSRPQVEWLVSAPPSLKGRPAFWVLRSNCRASKYCAESTADCRLLSPRSAIVAIQGSWFLKPPLTHQGPNIDIHAACEKLFVIYHCICYVA